MFTKVIRPGTVGTVVSYGDMLYRALDAVTTLRNEGVDVGLVNKGKNPTSSHRS